MRVLRSMDEIRIVRYDYEPIHGEILQLVHVKNIRMVLLKRIVADQEFTSDEDRELKYSVKSFAKLVHQHGGFVGM